MHQSSPPPDLWRAVVDVCRRTPLSLILLFVAFTAIGLFSLTYLALFIVAPVPRSPLPSEKQYTTVLEDGSISKPQRLPCWLATYNARQEVARRKGDTPSPTQLLDDPEVFVSVVVPAYNEEERLEIMLEEAVAYLQQEYTDPPTQPANGTRSSTKSSKRLSSNGSATPHSPSTLLPTHGWEILIVSDGSTDATVSTALSFARSHRLPPGALRVISLGTNRGKGGAVTHGLRHVRGRYAVFADADGASTFGDLGKLVTACRGVEDEHGRGVAVGSRAHLVGSDAVVKRSLLRNTLMHAFHLLIHVLTPPRTSRIADTQCGFKLFSRAALPAIVPHMHAEGWIFDVEMLMHAEAADVPVAEVAVRWKEVGGSKLNVVWDSLGMAWGLAVVRCAWALGVWRRG
ncbi:MAG: dolichyl-phosphate beta-glucosyltransferase [Piccolia ochrophora]|nr:MAG: dolichyl-phosphate beta-glucosyltransferase [Piccolia ochrophora]